MSINTVTLEALVPDNLNANKGTQRGTGLLEESLRKYGAGRSILIDKNNRIIAGNKTAESAASIGLDDVQIVETDGTRLVAVKRIDLDLDDPKTRELAIHDNRVGEINLDWDAAVLAELASEGVELNDLWATDELEALLADVASAPASLLTGPDEIPDEVETRCKPGDLWKLGEHRLLCGDSTKAEDVARLLNGAKPNLMVTDPPYGVEYDPSWREDAAEKGLIGFSPKALGVVANDAQCDWREAWAHFPGDVAYVWYASLKHPEVADSLRICGLQDRSQIVWAKTSFAISRGHYNWQHECCLYCVRKGKTASWLGDHSESTVWAISNSRATEDVHSDHGTQKPVECMAHPIRNHEGDVYEPFAGSGTTFIACEQLGRRCYGIEIMPAYCDVILARWENATGKTAERMMKAGPQYQVSGGARPTG